MIPQNETQNTLPDRKPRASGDDPEELGRIESSEK